MKYTSLGRSALKVSRFCLGTMNFGPRTTETESFAIMDKALELGIQFFDTADVYGRIPGEGITEKIVGRWLAQGGGRRERIVLATKVFGGMNLEGASDPNLMKGLSARKIIRGCEQSLRRLQTDWIDLYQMHHIDRSCRWEEIWQAMEILVQQGKVHYIGSSNFAGWDIATACQEASKRSFLGLVSEQSVYNLDNRTVELEVLPACRHYGVGVIPWSPLAGGLLAGTVKTGENGRRAGEEFEKRVKTKADKLKKYELFCKELGEEPAHVALAWLLHNPVVTAPIIGPRTMEQLCSPMKSLEINLDAAAMEKLDQIWPGPGGEAPGAYAW